MQKSNPNPTSFGRQELAQRYFPCLLPKSAWQKLRSLMLDYPSLAPLATMPRRTFTPREVALIAAELGPP